MGANAGVQSNAGQRCMVLKMAHSGTKPYPALRRLHVALDGWLGAWCCSACGSLQAHDGVDLTSSLLSLRLPSRAPGSAVFYF